MKKDIKPSSILIKTCGRLLLISIAVFMVIVVILIQLSYRPRYSDDPTIRITKTKYYLAELRKSIDNYFEENTIYPALSDVNAGRNMKEYISIKEGCGNVSQIFNGEGGWFYSPETGQLKVNLANSLNSYFFDYAGDHQHEVPSEW